jgi:hypothetical protein
VKGQVASFREVENLIFRFEEILKSHGIPIVSGSQLDVSCMNVLKTVILHEIEKPVIIRPVLTFAYI